jgi:hypothetical protein
MDASAQLAVALEKIERTLRYLERVEASEYLTDDARQVARCAMGMLRRPVKESED